MHLQDRIWSRMLVGGSRRWRVKGIAAHRCWRQGHRGVSVRPARHPPSTLMPHANAALPQPIQLTQHCSITITEHLGGRSASQLTALSTLDQPSSDVAQGPLETLDVRFRPGRPTMFKPYVSLPFDHAALVKVVTGPAIKHHLVEPTVRRMLDRNGLRHTTIEASELPYQTSSLSLYQEGGCPLRASGGSSGARHRSLAADSASIFFLCSCLRMVALNLRRAMAAVASQTCCPCAMR
jgi:hypothetical protein